MTYSSTPNEPRLFLACFILQFFGIGGSVASGVSEDVYAILFKSYEIPSRLVQAVAVRFITGRCLFESGASGICWVECRRGAFHRYLELRQTQQRVLRGRSPCFHALCGSGTKRRANDSLPSARLRRQSGGVGSGWWRREGASITARVAVGLV